MTAGPGRVTPLTLLGLAVVLVLLAVPADAGGRVLCLPAAVVLAALGARDLVLRPVLLADLDGVSVVSGIWLRRAPWSGVDGLRLVRDRRTQLLEVDLGGRLVVLGRLRLGRAPEDVLAELEALRPSAPLPEG